MVTRAQEDERASRIVGVCLLLAVALLWASTVWGQVVNPTRVEWDTTDHAVTTRYEVGYYLSGAAAPMQTVSVLPADVTGVDADTYTTPLPRPVLGSFTAKMRACGAAAGGGEVCSDWSNATDPFSLSPRAPVVRLVP